MSKKEKSKRLKILNPNAAGIDVGSETHYVCVPEGSSEKTVRSFKGFTNDLNNLANWLKECKVDTVVMESTGVYWIPLFQILESNGFEVLLVNAKYVKNVPGRKSDVMDCEWLQRIHSYGLFQGSFRPEDSFCILRSYMRQRDNLIRSTSTHVLRMQKALDQMNIKLHKVINSITGVTGLEIIKAIVEGERDPKILAQKRDSRMKNDYETIAMALEGDYREEHLFSLRQEYDLYMYFQEKIRECDNELEKYIKSFIAKINPGVEKKIEIKHKKPKDNEPNFKLESLLCEITKVDLTKIDGLSGYSVLKLISEVGVDMSKWPSEKHFSSWLGLCPNNKITGEKVRSTKTRKVKSKASIIFRMSAYTLINSKTALGAYLRRLSSRLGRHKAITATANKIARLFYRMLKQGEEYFDTGANYYEKKYKERVLNNLKKKAQSFGFQLVENQPVAE